MIPTNEDYDDFEEEAEVDIEIETEPSYTYAMHFAEEEENDDKFVGMVDDTEAIKQAIIKILSTERYEHEIYSWDYGAELQDLIGQPIAYVMSEVKDRITEALTADDRIETVDDFEIEQIDRHTLHVSFTVTTAQQDEIEMDTEVNV